MNPGIEAIDIVIDTPSKLEGYTHDVYVAGFLRFSIDTSCITDKGLAAIVSESMQIGAQMQLKQMGKFINEVSEVEQ